MLRSGLVGMWFAFLATWTVAAAVPGWRGAGTGVFDAEDPALTWSEKNNVIWHTSLEPWSNASPMVLGDKLYVCAEQTTLLCFDLATGKERWRAENGYTEICEPARKAEVVARMKEAEALQSKSKSLRMSIRKLGRSIKRKQSEDLEADRARIETLKAEAEALDAKLKAYGDVLMPATHGVNGFSTPTPTTDGSRVYVLFGNGVAACYQPEGERVWAKFVRHPTHGWGMSSSPQVAEGVMVVHIGPELFGLDASSGEIKWRSESKAHWGSPVLATIGDTKIVITTGVDVVRLADGKVLAAGLANMPWTSPLVVDDVLYVADKHECCAIPLTPGLLKGEVKKRWSLKIKSDRYYATPVLADGLLYAINRRGHMSVVDASKGERVYDKKLEFPVKGRMTVYPSPVLAGEHLIISADNGSSLVLKPGRTYEEVSRNTLEPFRSSPVFVGNRMYVRTLKSLFCMGKQ